jgi:hypothetical protein
MNEDSRSVSSRSSWWEWMSCKTAVVAAAEAVLKLWSVVKVEEKAFGLGEAGVIRFVAESSVKRF